MATFSVVQVLDVSAADADAEGCRGGSHDATYGYLMDHHNGAYQGKVARFDLATFSVVQVLDGAETDASLKTFYGGFQDCSYGFGGLHMARLPDSTCGPREPRQGV